MEYLKRSPPLFPAVGMALGLIACVFGLFFSAVFPALPAAALATALLAAFSGGLHLDGLADSADALFSATHDREKALSIMKDSRIGAHGAMALSLTLTVKFACLASLPPWVLPFVLFAVPVAGRAAMLFPMLLLPYVRPGGLGALFVVRDVKTVLTQAGIWIFAASAVACGLFGAFVCIGFCLGAALAWSRYAKKRLGGATGDIYGAACEIAETAFCLAAAAVYRGH